MLPDAQYPEEIAESLEQRLTPSCEVQPQLPREPEDHDYPWTSGQR